MKNKVLIVAVHPDDETLGCGGTLAKLISEGKTVAVVDLTQGELGTRRPVPQMGHRHHRVLHDQGLCYG